jgi:hypothetical protein
MGWSGRRNGELLKLMVGQAFEVFITVDQTIKHQQNLQAVGIALIVLVAPTSRLTDLVPLMPSTIATLNSIKPGDVVDITI